MPDEVVNVMKKYGAVYVKKHKEWTASLHKYKEAAVEIANFCRTRGIEMDLLIRLRPRWWSTIITWI
jgi:hypothetical protein